MQKTVLSILFLIAFLFGVVYLSFFMTPKYGKPITALYGYVDKFGDYVISPRFYGAENFSENLAAVQVDNLMGKWGYINPFGEFEIDPQYFRARPFSDGMAVVKPDIKSGYGYIDYQGKWVLGAHYKLATTFYNGMASVLYNNRRFYIDRFGQPLENQPAYGVTVFSDGMGKYSHNGKTGFMGADGEVVIPAQFLEAGQFANGLAPVKVQTSVMQRWGYIDKTGKMVIAPEFGEAGTFSQGLAPVKGGGFIGLFEKWGYINPQGQWVIKPRYAMALEFSEGLAPAVEGSKWGFIDKTGKFYIPPKFDWAQPFHEGLAMVGLERVPEAENADAPQ